MLRTLVKIVWIPTLVFFSDRSACERKSFSQPSCSLQLAAVRVGMALTMIMSSSVDDHVMHLKSKRKADSVLPGTGPSLVHIPNSGTISRQRNNSHHTGNQANTMRNYCETKLFTSFKQFCESFTWNDSCCGFFLGFLPTAWDLYTDFMFGGKQEVRMGTWHNLNSFKRAFAPIIGVIPLRPKCLFWVFRICGPFSKMLFIKMYKKSICFLPVSFPFSE